MNREQEVTDGKVLSFLGLATRAGKTVTGMDAVIEAVLSGAASLVITARDASERSRGKIASIARVAGVPCYCFADMEALGKFTGKQDRAICAVMDEGFAKRLCELLAANESAELLEGRLPNEQ